MAKKKQTKENAEGSHPAAPRIPKETTGNPVRTCLITRQEYPREYLVRFVVDPQGEVVEDWSGVLPGRGFYIFPSPANLEAMLKRPAVLRKMAGSHPLRLPDRVVLLDRVGAALTRRLMDSLGLARRIGSLRMGLRATAETLAGGEVPLILLAADTAANTRQKLNGLLYKYRLDPNLENQEILEILDRERIGDACGHGPMAVIGVLGHGFMMRVEADARRWRSFHVGGFWSEPLNTCGENA